MVDLMMWLVIAVLLLAAAIQGIGYYQKAAVIHQMENDLSGAGSNVMAVAANTKGSLDKATADEGVANTKFSKDVSPFVEVMSGSTMPYLRATHPSVTDLDVIYMFKDCLPLKVGLNIVPKTGGGALEACGIAASPDPTTPPSTGTPTTPPATTTPTTPPATTPPATTPPATTPPPVVVPASMITEWDTSIVPNNVISQDAVACQTIRLPLNGTVNATIDWGDGTTDTVTAAYPQHTYSTSGTKTISISGTFTGWVGENMSGLWSNECLTKVTKWDNTSGTVDGSRAFNGANHLTQVANIPSGITNYFLMFSNASIFNGDLSGIDVSKVTNMSMAFYSAYAFNSNISGWNTSSVTDMSNMFGSSGFNQPIGSWNTANVKNFSGMFSYNSNFNQPIGSWNTSSATDMNGMFSGTTFNQNISGWTTTNVADMSSMFSGAKQFNGDISNWNTAKVTNMNGMFNSASSFTGDLSRWNTGAVTDMGYMFLSASSFNSDISKWNTAKVTSMYQMFGKTTVFNQNLTGWNVSAITDARYFSYSSALDYANQPYFPAGTT